MLRTPDGPDARQIFVNEVLSNPENRINVALFGLMTQDWLRTWFLEQLAFPTDAVIYPPVNEQGKRPDFTVDGVDGLKLAWIEVELDYDAAQLEEYRSRFEEPVKAVWGRRAHGGDLSLEEVAERLRSELPNLTPQTRVNVEHLLKQFDQHLYGRSPSSSRAEVSDEMLDHPLVVGLRERLGDKLKFTAGRGQPGILTADTNSDKGFSLRAYSRVSRSRKSVSLLNISNGRPEVRFQPLDHLEKYLPDHPSEVADYAQLLFELGTDIGRFTGRQSGSLEVEVVVDALDRISDCVVAFADPPSATSRS